jgi:replicative DNA helicase
MRAIPQAPEVEKAIIGSMLMSSDELDKIGEILRLGCTKELFFTSTRRALFEFITDEYRNSRPIDKLELQTKLFNEKWARWET